MCFFLCNDGSPSRRDATSRWNDSVQLCDACMRRAYSIGTSSHELLLRPASSATRRRAHVPSARARSARAGAERADADVALSAPAHRRLDGERRCDITVLLVIEALLSEQWTTSDVALAPAPSTRNAYDGVGVDSVGPSTSAPRRPAAPERRRRSPRHTPATIVDARTNGVLHVGEATAQPKPQTPAARGDDIARCCSGSVPRPARDSVLTHDIERSGVRVAIAHDRPRRLDADEHHTMPAAPLTALSSRPPGLREGLHVVARSSDAVQPFFAASIKHRAAEFSPCRHGHSGMATDRGAGPPSPIESTPGTHRLLSLVKSSNTARHVRHASVGGKSETKTRAAAPELGETCTYFCSTQMRVFNLATHPVNDGSAFDGVTGCARWRRRSWARDGARHAAAAATGTRSISPAAESSSPRRAVTSCDHNCTMAC